MGIRLVVRGFVGSEMKFKDELELEERDLETLVPELAEKHAEAMGAGILTMIEIEFLDEPDPQQRFFRIGTDASGMVMPMRIL